MVRSSMVLVFSGLALIACLGSCKSVLSTDEFAEWWDQNKINYIQSKSISGTQYSAMLLKDGTSTKQGFTSIELRIQLESGYNFMHYRVQSDMEVQQRYAHLMGEFKRNVKVNAGDEEINCIDLIIQPTSGLTPYTSLILVFNDNLLSRDRLELRFIDDVTDTGIVNLVFENLDEIPEIKSA